MQGSGLYSGRSQGKGETASGGRYRTKRLMRWMPPSVVEGIAGLYDYLPAIP